MAKFLSLLFISVAGQPPFAETPSKDGASCFEVNVAYYGGSIKVVNDVDSPTSCQQKCQQEEKCHFFTWTGTKLTCRLKDSTGNKTRKKSTKKVSGPKNCVIEPITTEEPEEVTTKKEEVIEPITTEEPEEVTTKKEEGNCNSCDKFNDWKPLQDCKRWTSGLDECTGQNSRSWNRYCEKSCCKLKNCGKKD